MENVPATEDGTTNKPLSEPLFGISIRQEKAGTAALN
jgi:hypothetical protein